MRGCLNRVDIFTSTLGKALGGASGGFTSGRRKVVDLLRNRSRPYLFSNTLAPPIVAGSIAAIALLSESTALRDKLEANTQRFRAGERGPTQRVGDARAAGPGIDLLGAQTSGLGRMVKESAQSSRDSPSMVSRQM